MEKTLLGKNVVVIGGGGGAGRGLSRAFAAAGANILVNDTGWEMDDAVGGDYNIDKPSKKRADEVVATICSEGGRAAANYEDASDYFAAGRIVEQCLDEFGSIDILISCAVISRLNVLTKLSPEDWNLVINNNLNTEYNVTKHALPYMMKQNYGRLFYMMSAVIRSFWGQACYAAAKGGTYSFMRCIANEVMHYNITANGLDMWCTTHTGSRPAGIQWIRERQEHLGLPPITGDQFNATLPAAESCAPMAIYLCTEEGRVFNGQYFGINAGRISIYGTLEEKQIVYKDEVLGEWTVDELKKVIPNTLGKFAVPIWFSRP